MTCADDECSVAGRFTLYWDSEIDEGFSTGFARARAQGPPCWLLQRQVCMPCRGTEFKLAEYNLVRLSYPTGLQPLVGTPGGASCIKLRDPEGAIQAMRAGCRGNGPEHQDRLAHPTKVLDRW